MPNWRRAHVPGGSFFFTVVTEQRAPIFRSDNARRILGTCIRACIHNWPFKIDAIVLLPDHLHTIWSLPPGDDEYSKRWAWIKKEFTKQWISASGQEQKISIGKRRDGRRGVWQTKFWEHTLESEDDFEKHFDYIHYNPVKHGLTSTPKDWPWSSFHRWVRVGVYPEKWAGEENAGFKSRDMESTVGE